MYLRNDEIELIEHKIGAINDDVRVKIKAGVLRALINRNSLESKTRILELEDRIDELV